MKNEIRTPDGKGGWKIWTRRSKNLTSGEICCPRCGEWKEFKRLTDRHFEDEYICSKCKKELRDLEPPKPKETVPKKVKPQFPPDCKHKWFFKCKYARECIGCYYNPDKKIAMMKKHEDDSPKPKTLWFYHDKKFAKEMLKMLEDIKQGRGKYKPKN